MIGARREVVSTLLNQLREQGPSPMRGKTGYCFVAQASISFWALPKSPSATLQPINL